MSIAKRIAMLVLLGVIALVVQGSFSLWQMASINEGVRETEENLLPSIMTLDQAQIAFLRARPPPAQPSPRIRRRQESQPRKTLP